MLENVIKLAATKAKEIEKEEKDEKKIEQVENVYSEEESFENVVDNKDEELLEDDILGFVKEERRVHEEIDEEELLEDGGLVEKEDLNALSRKVVLLQY